MMTSMFRLRTNLLHFAVHDEAAAPHTIMRFRLRKGAMISAWHNM